MRTPSNTPAQIAAMLFQMLRSNDSVRNQVDGLSEIGFRLVEIGRGRGLHSLHSEDANYMEVVDLLDLQLCTE